MTATRLLMPMSDLQSDLRQLGAGLLKLLLHRSGHSQEQLDGPQDLVMRRAAADTVFAQPDLELDLPLELDGRSEPHAPTVPASPSQHPLLSRLRDPDSLRDAFVLKEILDKPRANRPFRLRRGAE